MDVDAVGALLAKHAHGRDFYTHLRNSLIDLQHHGEIELEIHMVSGVVHKGTPIAFDNDIIVLKTNDGDERKAVSVNTAHIECLIPSLGG